MTSWALAFRVTENEKLLARQENLLVLDDRATLLSGPES